MKVEITKEDHANYERALRCWQRDIGKDFVELPEDVVETLKKMAAQREPQGDLRVDSGSMAMLFHGKKLIVVQGGPDVGLGN